MTVDPIDQCTFYYTNEYLPNDGAFNWATQSRKLPVPIVRFRAGVGNTYRNGTFFTEQPHALRRYRHFEQWLCRRDQRAWCLFLFSSTRNLHRNGC